MKSTPITSRAILVSCCCADTPAQAGHEPDLLEQSRQCANISHESSPHGRSAPPCPTMERRFLREWCSSFGAGDAGAHSTRTLRDKFSLSMWRRGCKGAPHSKACDVRKMVTPRRHSAKEGLKCAAAVRHASKLSRKGFAGRESRAGRARVFFAAVE